MSEIWKLSAAEVAQLIKQGEISATEAAESALTRLDQVNPAINAVVDYNPEDVYQQAKKIDDARSKGMPLAPLAGVPITIKVNVDQAGFATTNGIVKQRDLIAKENSPVVDNFIKSGAVIIGRTNTPAFSYRWFTNNLVHGETFNPRNKALTPGGSSGGAAAATAAGIGHIGHGTDIAGSIRYPAYACGVHGLRPTLGRVAAYNATGAERAIGGQIMAVSGPIARTVKDLSIALTAMSAPDARDPWWVPAPLIGPERSRKAALCTHPDGMNTDPAIVSALQDAASKLKDAGWIVEEIHDLPPIKSMMTNQILLWMGDGYDAMVKAAAEENDIGAITALAGQADIAKTLSLEKFSDILKIRATVTRQWQLFLEEYAVLLIPVSAELPFDTHLDLKDSDSYKRVWESQATMVGLPFMGMPCLTLTTGSCNNRPVGIQIVAERYREDLCLAAAKDIESRSPSITVAMAD